MYIIFQNYNKQEGTGKFIYNPLILNNKQLLLNLIDCKATKVFVRVFCLNYPAILN